MAKLLASLAALTAPLRRLFGDDAVSAGPLGFIQHRIGPLHQRFLVVRLAEPNDAELGCYLAEPLPALGVHPLLPLKAASNLIGKP